MATGDADDMRRRLRALLPARWWPDEAPVLDATLSGIGSAWAWIHERLGWLKAQTRLATATGAMLDIVAQDFLGQRLSRRDGEADARFRRRIRREILRPRGTRAALIATLTEVTGEAPVVFEPADPRDTGGYGNGGAAYGQAGGYGSLRLPYQFFVVAYRPPGAGTPLVGGYDAPIGGYGGGAVGYLAGAEQAGEVADEEIREAVAGVIPAASVAWLHISPAPPSVAGDRLDVNFLLDISVLAGDPEVAEDDALDEFILDVSETR